MVDFGTNKPERPLSSWSRRSCGGRHLHVYSGLRGELTHPGHNPAMFEGRKRGVIFDVGHGGAAPLAHRGAGHETGSCPTRLDRPHIGSMNAGMKDMLNVMDKFPAMGISR